MASSLTLSQSMSIAAQPASLSALTQSGKRQTGDRTSLVHKVLLSAVFAGTEMATCFEQIFMTLSLQYLGVPIYLISLNGIFGGGASVISLVIAGNWVDKGNDPKKRKLITSIITFVFINLAFVLLIVASLFKLHDSGVTTDLNLAEITSWSERTTTPATANSKNHSNPNEIVQLKGNYSFHPYPFDKSVFTSTPTTFSKETRDGLLKFPETTSSPSNTSTIPFSAVLGIIAFAMIDFGFDFGTPVLRAYILANIPAESHSGLLIASSIVAASGGTLLSILGMVDLPGILEETFNVEGVAAMLILLSVLMILFLVGGFACTVLTTRYLSRLLATGYIRIDDAITPQHPTTSRYYYKPSKEINDISIAKDYIDENTTLFTSERRLSFPVDFETQVMQNQLAASGRGVVAPATFTLSERSTTQLEPIPEQRAGFDESNKRTVSTQTETRKNRSLTNSERSALESIPEMETHVTRFLGNLSTSFTVSGSSSASSRRSSFPGHMAEFGDSKSSTSSLQTVNMNTRKTWSSQKIEKNVSFCSGKLVILCVAYFFAVFASTSVLDYATMSLTVGVYHGDPTSVLGTESYFNYLKGQSTGALGTLIVFLLYFVGAVSTSKLFRLVGELNYLMVCSVFFALSLLAFVLCKNEEAYFVSMMAYGLFRTCLFTVPFLLANQYVQEAVMDQSTPGSEVDGSSHVGRAMAVMGAILPFAYLTLATMMGPVIDTVGSVWVPMIASCTTVTTSIVILFFMYCVT